MGPEGTNNAKTLLRRAQRKHSQQSYLAMKTKLLSLVRPLPKAIYVSDLELFRADLFQDNTMFTKAQPGQPEEQPNEALDQTLKDRCISDSVTCDWCGTWVPLPTLPILATPRVPVSDIKSKSNHKVLETDANIEAERKYIFQDIEAVCEKPGADFLGHPGAGDDSSDPVVESGDGKSNTFISQYGFADYFSPFLCEVVSTFDGDHGKDKLKCLRKQRVSAYRARLQQGGKPFPGFSWLASDVVPGPQTTMKRYTFKKQQSSVPVEVQSPVASACYSTDESTGECKVQ